MTLSELAGVAPNMALGQEPWQWPCFTQGSQILLLGRDGTFLATVVYDPESEMVWALELLGQDLMWVDPDHRADYLAQVTAQGIDPPAIEDDWGQCLALLAQQVEQLNEPRS